MNIRETYEALPLPCYLQLDLTKFQHKLDNRGDTAVMHQGPLALLKYQDSKPVYLLSTVSSGETIAIGRNNHAGEPIFKPTMVHQYNGKMGAVDRLDMMVAFSKMVIKTMKWWKKVIFHVLTIAAVNAYYMYKENTPEPTPLGHRQFRRKLVHEMLSTVGGNTSKYFPLVNETLFHYIPICLGI